jgi:hypothetical protein
MFNRFKPEIETESDILTFSLRFTTLNTIMRSHSLSPSNDFTSRLTSLDRLKIKPSNDQTKITNFPI